MSWLVKKSVLVPIDFSEWSYEAIAPAREYVESQTYLTLIHVLTPPTSRRSSRNVEYAR